MSTAPDVRVRLSAEGQREVIDAFRKIQGEAEKSGGGAKRAGELTAASSRDAATAVAQLARRFGIDLPESLTKYISKLGGVEKAAGLAFKASVVGAVVAAVAAALPTLAAWIDELRGINKQLFQAEQLARQLNAALVGPRDAGAAAVQLSGLNQELRELQERRKELLKGQFVPQFAEGFAALQAGGAAARDEIVGIRARMNELTSEAIPAAEKKFNDLFAAGKQAAAGQKTALEQEIELLRANDSERLRILARRQEEAVQAKFAAGEISAAERDQLIALVQTKEELQRKAIAQKEASQRLRELAAETKKLQERQQEYLASLREEVRLHGASAAEIERARAAKLGLSEETQRAAGFLRQLVTVFKLTQPVQDWAAILRGEATPALDDMAQSAEIARQAVEGVNEAVLQGPVQAPTTAEVVENLKQGLLDTSKLADVLAGGFVSLFQSAIAGGQGLRQVLAGILQDIALLILRALVLKTLGTIFGGLFGGGGIIPGAGIAPGVTIPGGAGGGVVHGPGTSTSDSILARLSPGEFVVRAAVVGQPGVLPRLLDLNAGDLEALNRDIQLVTHQRIRQMPRLRGFATGGLVEGGGGVTINNVINAQGNSGDTEAKVRRALAAEREQLVRAAVLLLKEESRRRP